MYSFYRIEDETLHIGSGTFVPDGYSVFTEDSKPKELIDALVKEKEKQKILDEETQESKLRDAAMLSGGVYKLNDKEYTVSFTKEDGDGLVQVKSAFELGLVDTVIHFSNGTKMPINKDGFTSFALWFVNKRNEFFK